ncbi:MAG: extracellular solute-binding protein [Devosia sp.]
MTNRLRSYAIGIAAVAAISTPALADDLTIQCRCVVGGVNSSGAEWITKAVIPAFEKKMKDEGKDIKVTLNQFAGEDAQLAQQQALDFSTGAGPDVAGFDGFLIPSFAEGNLLKPLDEVAGKAVDDWEGWSHIPEGIQSIMMYQGKRYGIPGGTDVRMIFTRKDLLKKAGIDPDAFHPKSWAELLDAARALKKAGVEFPLQLDAGVSMGEATTMQGYYMALLGTGQALRDAKGKWIVSSPGILDTLKLYKTIYVDDKLGDQRAQLLADGRNQSFANFRDGKTALLVEGDWFYREVTAPGSEFAVKDRDAVMGWAEMPAQKPGEGIRSQDFVTISGGTGYVLNPHTKHPDEAWALLAFMNSKDQQDALQTFQAGIKARDDVPVPNSPFLTKTAATLLPLTTARPNDPNYTKVSTAIQKMTENVVSGDMSPEDAMAQYKADVTEIVGADNTVTLQ